MNYNKPMHQEISETIKFLQDIKTFISDPNKWTKKALARTDKKYEVGPLDRLACCWDIAGALEKVAKLNFVNSEIKNYALHLLSKKSFEKHFGLLYRMNDASTHEEVLCFIQETIDDLNKAEC